MSKIIELPNHRKHVWDASHDKSNVMREIISDRISLKSMDHEPLSLAAERTIRGMRPEMTPTDEECFITAFVIFVVGILVDSKSASEMRVLTIGQHSSIAGR